MKNLAFFVIIMTLSGTVFSECSEGCLSCEAHAESNTFTCKICDTYNYYYMFPGNTVCEKIEIRNCEIPSVDRLCLQCAAGYIQDEVAGKCVQVGGTDLKPQCLRYSQDLACVECEEGHFMDGAACTIVTKTVTNCGVYSATDTCSTCKTGNFLVTDAESVQTCQSISKKSNCWRYSEAQCDECKASKVMNRNFFLDQTMSPLVIQENVKIVGDQVLLSTQQGNLCVTPSDLKCSSTDANTGECLGCTAGYYLNAAKVCTVNPEDSIPNCGVYTAPGTCEACAGAFYLSGNACLPVTSVEHCKIYQITSNACYQCESEYWVNSAICSPRVNIIIPGCKILNLNLDSCMTCHANFVKSTDQSKCFPVIANCDNQNLDTNVCTTCGSDHYPNASGSMCLPQYVANCSGYTDNTNTCSGCIGGYHLDGNICKPLWVANCITPSTTTIGECTTCHDGYYKDTGDGNKCKLITVQNCNGISLNQCAACVTDGATKLFYLQDVTKACLPYDLRGCTTPVANSNTCATCDTGNGFQLENGACRKIPMPGCSTYNFSTNVCSAAAAGYYIDATTSSCQRHSVRNCSGFSATANECTTCTSFRNFYKLNGTCIPYDLPGCDMSSHVVATETTSNQCHTSTCISGYFTDGNFCKPYTFDISKCQTLNTSKDECTACKPASCTQTANTTACPQLLSIDPKSKVCVERTLPGCAELLKSDGNKCHTCYATYYKSGDLCRPYTKINCMTFNPTADECATCDIVKGYSLDSTSKNCIKLDLLGCVGYSTTEKKCLTCAGEFVLDGGAGTCTPPISNENCAVAKTDGTGCLYCKEGNWLSGVTCTAYSEANIEHCVFPDPTADVCLKCKKGYAAISPGCTLNTAKNCYDISTTDAAKCASCAPGFKFDSDGSSATFTCLVASTFTSDANCLYTTDFTDGKCTKCKNMFNPVVSDTIHKVTLNCVALKSDDQTCTQCAPGYKLTTALDCEFEGNDGTTCVQNLVNQVNIALASSTNCAMCSNPVLYFLNGSTTCTIRTQGMSNCKTYSKSADHCGACDDNIPLLKGQDTVGYGVCQTKHALVLKATASEAVCAAYDIDELSTGADNSADLQCKVCNPGMHFDATKTTLTNIQCALPAGIAWVGTTFFVDRTYKPQVDELVASLTASGITDCDQHVLYDDATNAAVTQTLGCAQCASTKIGELGLITGVETYVSGNAWNNGLKDWDNTGNGLLFSKCVADLALPGKDATPTAVTITATNCEAMLTIGLDSGAFGIDTADLTDVCFRCRAGYQATVTPFVVSGTTSATLTGKIKGTLDCASRNWNLQKKYKGLLYNAEPTPESILHAITHDSCRDGSLYGIYAGLNADTNYYIVGTPDVGNKFEACLSNYGTTIANCQVSIFDYSAGAPNYFNVKRCAACKPGYAMNNFNDNNSCTRITNCDLSNDETNTWMNSCETCQPGFIWKYDANKINYHECIESKGIEHCVAIKSNFDCVLCAKGYDLINKVCVSQLDAAPDCAVVGYNIHLIPEANSTNISDAPTRRKAYVHNMAYFNLIYRGTPAITGCSKCNPGFDVGIIKTSSKNVCGQATFSSTIPFCKNHAYVEANGTAGTCLECQEGYILGSESFDCLPYLLKVPGCMQLVLDTSQDCNVCAEDYTRVTVQLKASDTSLPFSHCISNDYLENPDTATIEVPIFKEGFRPRDWAYGAGEIISIGDNNPCAQYAGANCIKCKKPAHVPQMLDTVLAANMKNFTCVYFEKAVDVYPMYLYTASYINNPSFSLKGFTTLTSTTGNFYIPHANKVCFGNSTIDPLCEVPKLMGCTKCRDGFYVTKDVGQNCKQIPVVNCLDYQKSICVKCSEGYYLNGAVCTLRTVLTCKTFSLISDTCTTCPDGFYITSAAQCTKGSIKNCAKLNMFGNYCNECAKGYYIGVGTASCTARKVSNCKTYFLEQDFCGSCEPGYYLSNGVCVEFTAQNCLTMRLDSDHCETCPPGMFLDDVLNCSLPLQNHCATFHPFEDKCLSCSEGYFLGDGTCLEYTVRNCKTFSPERDSCLQCNESQYLKNNGTASNDCFNYTVSNCAVADPFKDRCLSCLPGHFNQSGTCWSYTVDNCILSDPFSDRCHICDEGFVQGLGSLCVRQSAQNCSTFLTHIAGCSICNEGFFVHPSNKNCVPYTVPRCETYSRNSDKCLVCASGTYLKEGKCIAYNAKYCSDFHPFQDRCLTCREGFYMFFEEPINPIVFDMNLHVICKPYSMANCVERNNNNNKCIRCEEAHYLDANSLCQKHSSVCKDYDMYRNSCLSCTDNHHFDVTRQCVANTIKNCKTLVPNEDKCLTCDDDRWMLDSRCNDYTAKNCKTFKAAENACEECVGNGFFKNPSGACIQSTLVDHCQDYSTTNDQCSKCAQGFYKVSASECRVNPTGVKNCLEYQDKETCKRCKADHFLLENVCYLSSSLVTGCVDYIKDGICSLCTDGQVLDFNNTCAAPTNTTCLTHENAANCASCGENKILKPETTGTGDTAVTAINCVDSGISDCKTAKANGSTATCEICKDGFILASNSCTSPSTTISGCLQYVKEGECSRCVDEKLLSADKKVCESDVTGVTSDCLVGHKSTVPQCYQCEPGYRFDKNGNCEKCGGTGCDICSATGDSCTVCSKGYYMTTQLTCHAYPSTSNRVIEDQGTEETSQESISILARNTLMALAVLILGSSF